MVEGEAGVRAVADKLLAAFARSDLDTIAALCADDVVLWGTDEGESWSGKAAVLAAFENAYDLGVSWVGEPVVRDNWLAGHCEFTLEDGTALPSRVTMVFTGGLLAHAHYSVVAAPVG